jgi:hypothetical protein
MNSMNKTICIDDAVLAAATTQKKQYSVPQVTEHGTVEQITGSNFLKVVGISGHVC